MRRLRITVYAAAIGISILLLIANVDVGARWYYTAAGAAAAIGFAILLRRELDTPPARCEHLVGSFVVYVCQRPLGHRGLHRDRSVRWGNDRQVRLRSRGLS